MIKKDIDDMNPMELAAFMTGTHKFVVQSGNEELIKSFGECLNKLAYMTHPSTINQLVMDEWKKKHTVHVISNSA